MTDARHDPRRRRLLQAAALTTAACALPVWARQATATGAGDAPILRAIPSSGERIPVIGLGTNAYGVQTAEEKAPLRAVLQRLAELQNSVVDTAPSYRNSEGAVRIECGRRQPVIAKASNAEAFAPLRRFRSSARNQPR